VIEVREARPGEYDRAGEITVTAYAALPGDHLAGGYDEELRAADRRAKEAVLLVATDAGAVVGSVTYVPDTANAWAEGLAEGAAGIRMLAVDPAVQRRGVGLALVEACIARARADGKQRVALHSTDSMTTAHRLYERLGFQRDPARDWRPDPRILLLGFVLDLGR
jgi:predicted N-acetyltransferase YhbS